MENEVKQRNQRNRRRERAQRMQAQRENKVKDGDSGEDESPAREKPPRPPARRKKSREPLGEEDIIDGFAIMAFRTYEDLEAAVKCASSPRTNALSTKPRLPFVSLATDPTRNHPPNNVNSHGITLLQDAGTSDDSGRASERLTGSSVAPRDPDSSRDRLSDASSRCSSGKGYICDSEGDDDKASPENSRNASPRYHDTSMDDGSDAGTLFRVAGAGGGKNELVARGGSGGALALSRAPVGGSASPAPAPLPQPAPSPAPAALPPPALPPPNFRPDAPHRPNGAHIPPDPHHLAAATHIPARVGPDTPERPASNTKPQTGARAAADSPTPAPPAPPAPSPLFPSHSAFQSHAAAALPDYRHTNHETRTEEGAAPAPLDLGGARAGAQPARALPPPRPAAPLAPPASPVSLPSSPRAVSPAVHAAHAARPYPVSSIPSSHVNSSISSSIYGLASPYSQPGPPKHSVPAMYGGRPPHLAPYGMAPLAQSHGPHAPPHLSHSMLGHGPHHPHPLSNPLMAPLPSHLGPPPPLASATSTISSFTTSLKHPVVPTLSGPLSAPAHPATNHVDALPSLPISSSAPSAVTTPTNSSRSLPPPINLDSRPQSVESKEPRTSALEPRPGALELRPPTIEPRPSTHETPRTTIDHRPQALDVRPSALDNRPVPMDTRPSPLDSRQSQIDTRPVPIDTRPTPMDTRPIDIRPPLDTRPTIFDARSSLIDSRPVDTRPLDTRPSTLDIRTPTSSTEMPRSEHSIVSSIQSSNGYPPPAIYSSAAYPPLYAPYASSLQHSPYLPPSAASPRNTADARGTLSSPLVAPKTPKGVRPHTPGSSAAAGPQPLSYSPVGRSPSRERDGFSNVSSLSRSTVAPGANAVPTLAPPLSAPLAPPITCGLAAPTPTAAAASSAGPLAASLASSLAPVPTVPSISSGAKPAAHWGVTRPSTERSSGFGPVPPLFGAPLPPPPNPNPFSAESLFQTNPGADLLRRELDSRFLAAATRTEMHHHQHQHTHVHQHHQLHPALHPSLHPPQYKDVNKMPSLYRSGLGLGYPYSSSLMHPAAPYVPPAPITPYAPKPASDAAKPAPRPASKTGKWNAMHVRIAWEIYNHQQKEKAGGGGAAANPADKEKRAFPTSGVTPAANPYRGPYEVGPAYLHQHGPHPSHPGHPAVPRYDPAAAERLRQAGVGYARYLPPHAYPLYRELPALHAVPPPLPALHDPWRSVPRAPPPAAAAAAAALQDERARRERERDERERRDRDDRERRKAREAERTRARSPLRNGAPDPPKLEAKEPPRGPHALPSYPPPPHAWDPYRAFDPLHHMRFAPLVEAAIRAEEDRAKMLSAYAHHHHQMKAGPLLHRGLGPPPPLPPLAAPLGPLPPMSAPLPPPLDLLKKEEPR